MDAAGAATDADADAADAADATDRARRNCADHGRTAYGLQIEWRACAVRAMYDQTSVCNAKIMLLPCPDALPWTGSTTPATPCHACELRTERRQLDLRVRCTHQAK